MSFPTRTHIAIIGEMGVGKTSVGLELAERLGRPFLDSDALLLSQTGTSGGAIAERDGVEALHRLEAAILEKMADAPGAAVIAPAASVIDDPSCRELLKPMLTIWLTAAPEAVASRFREGEHRRTVSEAERNRLRAVREPLMAGCTRHRIDTTGLSIVEVVDRIAALLPHPG